MLVQVGLLVGEKVANVQIKTKQLLGAEERMLVLQLFVVIKMFPVHLVMGVCLAHVLWVCRFVSTQTLVPLWLAVFRQW